MLNLKERTNNSVQIPDEVDVALYYNDEEKLVLKNSTGVVEEIITTATTPNPKVFKGLITQVGTSDPTLNIIVNTTGATITAAYSDVGIYSLQSSPPTFNDSTLVTIGTPGESFVNLSGGIEIRAFNAGTESILINTSKVNFAGSSFDAANSLLINVPISIEIYE